MKDALIEAQNQMYEGGIKGNYSPEENLHLTLAFIGEYPDPEAVLEALSSVSFTPFTLELQGLGCFGELWWAGMKESAPLAAVAKRVRRALADAGIPFDKKRFSPHITLIRNSSGTMPEISMEPFSMSVESISLFRSDRGKGGMIYTEIGMIQAQL